MKIRSLFFVMAIFLMGNIIAAEPSVFSDNALLFSGNANPKLVEKVAEYLDVPVGIAKVNRFNDGEIQIKIEQNVRNKDIFILQSTCISETQSINDNLMELFLLIRTMKRSSAANITAVIPYYGYARQDRKTVPRVPISAADVALLLEIAGVNRVVTIDLHCGQIQGFFRDIPVDNLYGGSLFADYFINKGLNNVVVVSPDAGGVDRARRFMENLATNGISAEIAMISKQREQAGVVASMNLIGEVKGSDVIIVDDICDTAGTLVKAAQLLKDEGAQRVFVAVTHPVFSNNALEKIRNSVIEEMIITDTIPLRQEPSEKIHCISVAPLLGEAIRRIQCGESLSELFK
jgi:ribose-phosphate pyrophosphokinase